MGDVTDIRPTDKKVETWLAALIAHESVTRLQASAGQVLIHRDHVPSGVYVVLSGDLALNTAPDAADAWAVTADRPYLLPHPAELDLPAGCAARVRTTVDLIHVPRSLMWLAPEIGHLLQHAPIPAVSLVPPVSPGGPAADSGKRSPAQTGARGHSARIHVSSRSALPTRSSPSGSSTLPPK